MTVCVYGVFDSAIVRYHFMYAATFYGASSAIVFVSLSLYKLMLHVTSAAPPSPCSRMDDILTQFIQRTKADPSLARDLLDATQWDLQAALAVYDGFSVTYEPQDGVSVCLSVCL